MGNRWFTKHHGITQIGLTVALVSAILTTLPVPLLYVNLGGIYLLRSLVNTAASHDLEMAVGWFDQAEQNMSLPIRLQYSRGKAYLLREGLQRALDEWYTFPEEASYRLTLEAKILLQQAQPEAALELLQFAVELAPTSSTAYFYGGLALYQLRHHTLALEWYLDAVNSNQFDARFHSKESGDTWWPARPESLTHAPSAPLTYVYLAAIYYELEEFERMRDAAQRATELAPDEVLGYLQLGTAYYRMADYKRAEETFVLLADQMSAYQYPYYLHLARTYRAQGKVKEAEATYKLLLESTRNAGILQEIVDFYTSIGEPEKADLFSRDR